jgi:mitochondrial chaperone BCS1
LTVLQRLKAGEPFWCWTYYTIVIELHYRLLFATTNHIERLDPALSRPGRMDVWVNFTHATKWQAEGIFKCFFPSKPASDASPSTDASPPVTTPTDASQKNLPVPKRKAFKHAVPLLSEAEISELAKRFAEAIPEDEMSVCEDPQRREIELTGGVM